MSGTKLKSTHSKGNIKLVKAMSTLNDTDIFKGINPKELSILFDGMDMQNYPAGTILFMPEDSCEKLFILKQGQVDLYQLTPSGKRLVTRRISPGTVFGMMGLLGQTVRGNFAETTEESTICNLTREDVLAVLTHQPDIAIRILDILGNRLRLLEERLVSTVYSPVIVRLAHFLLTNTDTTSSVLNNVTHEEIGNVIGAVRQTVTEALNSLKNHDLILIKSKHIQIIDRQGLEKIVEDLEI